MHKCKNIAITGSKDSGKSTLANWILNMLCLPYAGFRTVQYGQTPAGPLYEMVDILTNCRIPISEYRDGCIRGIPESFDHFGVQLVEAAIGSPAPVILLDEIGRFERYSGGFLKSIISSLDSTKLVVAVLKQESLPHIQDIKLRGDTLLIDLDSLDREEAWAILSNWIRENPFSF